MRNYHSLLIILSILFLYALSKLLCYFKIIKQPTHKKIWNITLALTFLLSGILGVIIAISLDNKLSLTWYRDMLWYHVEFGIAMAMIALLHFTERMKYYLNIFKRNK
jgi:uncharacterized membrane protein YeiB